MAFSVKEIFYSLQGEGARTGRPAVFCRFSGCNLWSGESKHRASAECNFCDTDFIGVEGIGGGKFKNALALAEEIAAYWPKSTKLKHRVQGKPYVVFTGGEPLLQLNEELIEAMHALGFEVGVETNGTLAAPEGIDWLCVSPKGQTTLRLLQGSELKLVYPQQGVDPSTFSALNFEHLYLQPLEPQTNDAGYASGRNSGNNLGNNSDNGIDEGTKKANLNACMDYCLANPNWKLSLQTHKTLGIR